VSTNAATAPPRSSGGHGISVSNTQALRPVSPACSAANPSQVLTTQARPRSIASIIVIVAAIESTIGSISSGNCGTP
jgi:hypothetical protein